MSIQVLTAQTMDKPPNLNLLWVESSLAMQKMMQRKLGEISCCFSDSLPAAALVLEQQPIDVLLVAQTELEENDFLTWLQDSYPEVNVVILMDEAIAFNSANPRVQALPAATFLRQPQQWLQEHIQPALMRGELRQVNLFDLARLFCLSPQGKRLCIYDPAEDLKGELYFQQGMLVSAKLGNLSAKQALCQMMGLKKGFFAELPWQTPPQTDFQEPFEMLIMQVAQYLDESSQTASQPDQATTSHLRILTIDHNPLIQQMYQAFFGRYAYDVQVALNASQALNLLEKERFDVIILEIALSDEQGKRLLQQIQRKAYAGKIIIVSESDSEAVKRFCQAKGAVRFFAKPLALKELYTFLRYLFKQRSFRGTLTSVSLIDLFQILLMDGQAHQLEFSSGTEQGKLVMQSGRLLFAEWGPWLGEEAFFQILQIRSGTYREIAWSSPPEENIHLSTGQLLLRAGNLVSSLSKSTQIPTDFKDQLQILKDVHLLFLEPVNEAGTWGPLKLTESQLQTPIQVKDQVYPLQALQALIETLGVELRFDARGQLEQLGFLSNFQGQTQAGLRMGDSVEQITQIYGTPQYLDASCAIWDQMAVFLNQAKVESFYLGAL